MPPPATATTSAISPPSIQSTAFLTGRWWLWDWWPQCFCFFSLAQVITMLVVTRILLQFLLQHLGVMLLRVQRPELPRPFRMPLYPLPPLAAMAGFVFILVNRSHALGGLAVAAGIAVSGTLIYLFRARKLKFWPFVSRQ